MSGVYTARPNETPIILAIGTHPHRSGTMDVESDWTCGAWAVSNNGNPAGRRPIEREYLATLNAPDRRQVIEKVPDLV